MGVPADFTSAQGAFNTSQNYGALGAGAGAVGDLFSGLGGFQQSQYQARVAQNAAIVEQQNAMAAQGAGQYAAQLTLLRGGTLAAQQKVAQAANGVDVGVGSPTAVQAATRTVTAMDAAVERYNAAKQAYSDQVQAGADEAQAKLYKEAGVNTLAGGLMKSGTTLLRGASSLASKWAQFGLSTTPAPAAT